MVARGGFTPQLVAVLPWDQDIPSGFTDHPMYSWHMPEHTRSVRAPVRVRLDEEGGFHVLGDASPIVHLDAAGVVRGRTPVAGRILDYACDAADNCALIEPAGDGDACARALDVEGSERWSRAGRFTKVIAAGDRLFLAEPAGIADADAATGEIRRTLGWLGGEPFMGGGRLVAVSYDESADRRGIVVLDPDTGAIEKLVGADEHYAWLVHPFGADGQASLFVWRDGQVARVSVDGDVEVLGAVDGIAVRDRSVFTSRGAGDHVVVVGEGLETPLAAAGLRLVSVDARGRFHLLGGEGPGTAGELRVYSSDGRLESSGPPPDDLAAIDCRVPLHTAWQVDARGRVTIPVVAPEGVAIVRFG